MTWGYPEPSQSSERVWPGIADRAEPVPRQTGELRAFEKECIMAISFFGGGRDGKTQEPQNQPLGAAPTGNRSGNAMRFAMINEVRAYWEALRDGPRLPTRAQIDPRGIAGALEGAFILERIAPGIARFRLAGMHLVDLMGMEVRGMPLSALFDPVGRRRLAEGLESVLNGPAVLDLRLEAERGIGRPALQGRMLILPIADDRGRSEMALGVLATEGQFGRSPRRFAISNMMLEHLQTQPAPQPALAPRREPAMQSGMAEYPELFKTKAAPTERPYLRLVRFGD
ncbi:MAG: PAS domain-containing protein [Paracoccaceae bacterium]